MTKRPFQQVVFEEKTIWATHEGRATVLEHLNFFNKVINELLTIDVKIDEEDKTVILLSRFHSHTITSSPPYSTVRKLSSWRLCPLSYLMRLAKDQIKRSRQYRVWWSGTEKKRRKERSGLIKGVSLSSQRRSLNE